MFLRSFWASSTRVEKFHGRGEHNSKRTSPYLTLFWDKWRVIQSDGTQRRQRTES